MAYIARARPPIFILENVKNLGTAGAAQPGEALEPPETDLEALQRQFSALGYLTWHSLLNSKDFGIPQNRARYYIIGYSVSQTTLRSKDYFSGQHWLKMCGRVVHTAKTEPLPVARFLLDSTDSRVQRAREERVDTKRGRGGVEKPANEMIYSAEHLGKFQMHSLAWPPDFDEEFLEVVSGHPDRVKELVFFLEQTNQPLVKQGVELFADVNLSIGWCRLLPNIVPCLVSTTQLWSVSRRRIVCGEETLALQGFCHSAQRNTKKWRSRQLVDLAGNAFNGAVLVAVLTAALSSFPWQQMPPHSATAQPEGSDAGQLAVASEGETCESCEEEDPPPAAGDDQFVDMSLDDFVL